MSLRLKKKRSWCFQIMFVPKNVREIYFFTCPTRKYKPNLFSFGMQKASKIKRFEQFLFPNYYWILYFGPKTFLWEKVCLPNFWPIKKNNQHKRKERCSPKVIFISIYQRSLRSFFFGGCYFWIKPKRQHLENKFMYRLL